MKQLGKSVTVLLIAALFSTCGGKVDGVQIVGEVDQIVPDGWVVLEVISERGPVPVDTSEIASNGRFSLVAKVNEPGFYRMNFNNRQRLTLILTGEETKVVVNADGNTPNGNSEVTGSKDTDYMRQMDELVRGFQADQKRISAEAAVARNGGDVETYQAIVREYQDIERSHNVKLKELVWESLPSLAAFYGVQSLDPEQYFTFFDSVSTELNTALPNNPVAINLSNMVGARRTLTIGSEAPEIALPNPDGEVISLSSLRGKYVLIDFWAAWCRPCRAENPNVVRVYNKYQDKNFEILGVSLDRTKEAWEGAIEQDGLPWLHISDLKYWNSIVTKSYQINSIPATYLIDPEGKIIAKNLRGPSLEAKLKEIFG